MIMIMRSVKCVVEPMRMIQRRKKRPGLDVIGQDVIVGSTTGVLGSNESPAQDANFCAMFVSHNSNSIMANLLPGFTIHTFNQLYATHKS